MIRINLLPHREIKRAAKQRVFNIMAGAVLGLAAVIAVMVYILIQGRIDLQNERNSYLEAEIAKLDTQIKEIDKLKEQKSALLARKQVVEQLEGNRSEVVRLFDQMVRQLPDGIYLSQIEQKGAQVKIQGYAQSSARVSSLMRNLDASPWLENPSLVEIKAANVNNLRVNQFELNITLVRPEVLDENAKSTSKDKQS